MFDRVLQAEMSEIRYCYEDLTPGQVFDHGARTITAAEIAAFAEAFDPQPSHLIGASLSHGPTASNWHVCGIMMRLFYDSLLHWSSSEGSPGIDRMEWPTPVTPGDTLRARSMVTDARPLKSRPGIGLVHMRHSVVNQNGETVMVMDNPGMFRMRAEPQS
jgi:acyl dehydratase